MARHESNDLMDSREFDESVEQLEMYEELEYDENDLSEQQQEFNDGDDDDGAHEQETVTGDPLQSFETKPIFECGDCTIGFTTTLALLKHRRDEHGVDEMEDETSMCETCDIVFQDVGELEEHILEAHGDQMVTVEGLEEVDDVTVAVEEEQPTGATEEAAAVDAEVERFGCERCDKQLDSQKALDEHILEHDLTDAK